MIVLDTDAIAEPMRARPDARVIAWLDRQQPRSLFTTAVALAELLVGIEFLPAGQRRDGLKRTLTASVASHFGRRILPFRRACGGVLNQATKMLTHFHRVTPHGRRRAFALASSQDFRLLV